MTENQQALADRACEQIAITTRDSKPTITLFQCEAQALLNLLSWRQKEAAEARAARDKLQAFKSWTHDFLDAHGVPHHPPGSHGAEGCRIGDRMDWLMARLSAAESDRDQLRNLCQQLEIARDERDAYRRDLDEIGRIIGCGHVEDGLARCVRDALAKAKE